MGGVTRSVVQGALFVVLGLAVAGCTTTPTTAAPPAATATVTVTATPPSATPTPPPPTATPAGTVADNCPVGQSVCAAALELSQLLTAGNFDRVVERSTAKEWECPGPAPRGAGDAFPLCQGSSPGEKRMGYQHARILSEGSVLSAEQYRELLRSRVTVADPSRSDSYGPGDFRLVSVGCPQGEAQACAQQYAVAFSYLPKEDPGAGGTPGRGVLYFMVEQPAGATAPQISMVVDGGLFEGDPHEVVVRGGTAQTISPQGMGPFGTFHLWTPNP